MSDFSASIKAILDTSDIENQINSKIGGKPVKFSNISFDTKSIQSAIEIALKSSGFSINIKDVNVQGVADKLKSAGTSAGKGFSDSFSASVQKSVSSMSQLTSLAKQLGNINFKIATLNPSKNQSEIEILRSQYDNLINKYNELKTALSTPLTTNQESYLNGLIGNQDKLDIFNAKLKDTRNNIIQAFSADIENGKFATQIESINKQASLFSNLTDSVRSHVNLLNQAFSDMNNTSLSEDARIASYERYKKILPIVTNEFKKLKEAQGAASKANTLSNEMQSWLINNAKAAEMFGDRIRELQERLQLDPSSLTHVREEFAKIKSEANLAGVATTSFGNSLYSVIKQALGISSITMALNTAIKHCKEGVKTVVELDTSLIDLKKTSTASASELKSFYFEANETAKELGATTKEIIQGAADWSRLGYSLADAEEMARVSAIFNSISPDLNIEQSTDALVSAMKAFGVEAEDALDGIASKINIIGNTQAVSNGDIVDIITRSSSAMAEANNTLEETIALGTAATEITRDAASVGTALRTISMRIRGYDEETSEYIGGIEQLSGAIANLTKTKSTPGGISLFSDAKKTEYKSTIQLLREISEIYDELTDKQQAELLETLGGKRGGQMIAAILGNFETVEKSLNSMANSAGNAMKEMETIYGSLEYKINALKETGTGILQNLFQREDIGTVVDALTKLLEFIDKATEKLGLFKTTIAGLSIGGIGKSLA